MAGNLIGPALIDSDVHYAKQEYDLLSCCYA